MHLNLLYYKIRIVPHKVVLYKIEWHKCLTCNKFWKKCQFPSFPCSLLRQEHRGTKGKKEVYWLSKWCQRETLENSSMETRFNLETVKKHLFSFLHPTPILSSWPYRVSSRTQNSYSTTKFIKLHYNLCVLIKDKIDLRRYTKTHSSIQFSTTNINWMHFMGKVCLRWLKKGGRECKDE